ncbi:hypothetical protein ACFWUW_30875 [Streptomyces sp. NPDC058655]|uniref:hypothetical protein n=1 Tax=Streptomyces sp. NPDC058655 TaxID=3346577 RepID=UPI00364CA0E3
MTEHPDETAAGLARIEGFLMSQAALLEAREEGQAFARTLTWLGPDEQDDRFAHRHLSMRREMLATTVARAAELKDEYAHWYGELCRRATGLAAGVFALWTAVLILLCRP